MMEFGVILTLCNYLRRTTLHQLKGAAVPTLILVIKGSGLKTLADTHKIHITLKTQENALFYSVSGELDIAFFDFDPMEK